MPIIFLNNCSQKFQIQNEQLLRERTKTAKNAQTPKTSRIRINVAKFPTSTNLISRYRQISIEAACNVMKYASKFWNDSTFRSQKLRCICLSLQISSQVKCYSPIDFKSSIRTCYMGISLPKQSSSNFFAISIFGRFTKSVATRKAKWTRELPQEQNMPEVGSIQFFLTLYFLNFSFSCKALVIPVNFILFIKLFDSLKL